jgi:hypothetical protein
MITNRRSYYLYPSQIDAAIELSKHIRELTVKTTGRDFRTLLCLYGPLNVLVFDMRHVDHAAMDEFGSVWYPMLFEQDLVAQWFQNVRQMTNEIWGLVKTEKTDGETAEAEQVDGYWKSINQRLVFQPYASNYKSVLDAAKEIKVETRKAFQQELVLTQCYLGASNRIALEMDFDSLEEQRAFSAAWMKWLKEVGLFKTLFEHVQEGTNEIWQAFNYV